MKKIIVIMLVSVLFLCACGSDAATKNRTEDAENKVENTEKCTNNSYKIEFSANTVLDEGEFRVLCPKLQFEEENNHLEEKINTTLHQASTSWINKAFIKKSKNTYQTKVFCHTSRFLSVGQSYETYDFITNDYITIDLMTGKQIFLNDIITDIKELAQILHDGKIMTASRNAFTLDQNEADAALRQSLTEMNRSQIEKMLQQCSLEQKQFPLPTDKEKSSLPFTYERPNFYIQSGVLVIEEGEWHSEIFLKFKDIDYLLEPKYKEYLLEGVS